MGSGTGILVGEGVGTRLGTCDGPFVENVVGCEGSGEGVLSEGLGTGLEDGAGAGIRDGVAVGLVGTRLGDEVG